MSARHWRRREWLAAAAALAAAGPLRASQPFPTARPITLWVPWPAGGATDITMRLLADIASRHLGQRVVVENKPGAGGTMAMPVLQQAEPDGYTIAQIPQPVLRVPYTQKVLWDPVRDVTPIIQLSGVTFGVLVPGTSRFRTLDDLFAFAREQPGELSIATNGVGTTPHVVLEELFTARGLKYIHVPYKGTAEQLLAVETGQVMVGVNSTGFAPLVDSGRLRLLATFAAKRSPRWPTVPTLKELGFNIVAMSPYGLGGPRGLSPAIVATLHDAFRKAMLDPAFVQEIAKYDQELDYLGPAEYGAWLREQYAREKLVVERMGLSRAP
jgi:tripartite-type tricarboxylate transporter receptor subunit TctC